VALDRETKCKTLNRGALMASFKLGQGRVPCSLPFMFIPNYIIEFFQSKKSHFAKFAISDDF